MSRTKTNAELDSLIDEITADCYDEDEQLQGFENAFDEDATANATDTYEIALLDVELDADPDTSRLIAAYRRWMGT